MNPNYRTLNKDIGMIQRTNNGWDLWFDNGDLVKAEDFHSLQVGIIIACLTSWNYMNRYGNPTYEVFGNRAYQLLKANKSSMVQYKIQQFFMECLKRMRRVYDVVSLTVSEVPYEPHKYFVEFEVISISNQLVDGSFTITTDTSKSSSYIEYTTYMPYASNENDLVIDLWLKNEYGGGLEGEILYMYLKRGDDDYEFRGVVGQTDENGYLRVTYNPWDDETSETRHSDDVNIIYFDFHGNTTYNPSTSKRTSFKTELFEYFIEFTNEDIADYKDYADLSVRLRKKSLLDNECYPLEYTTVTVFGTDGRIYEALTDPNGEATVRVEISENTLFTTYYNNKSDETSVSIIKQTPNLEFSVNKNELYVGEFVELRAVVTDELDRPISDFDVKFVDGESIISVVNTDKDGVAKLLLNINDVEPHEFIAILDNTNFYNSVESNSEMVNCIKHSPSITLDIVDSLLIVDNPINFIAKVTENNAPLYNLDVEFKDEMNNSLGIVRVDNGFAILSYDKLDIGEHTIYAKVIETEYYESDEDSLNAQVLPHDYTIEISGNITSHYQSEYTIQVSVSLYDHDVLSDGVSFGDDSLIIESVETGDEWDMEESNSSQIFETNYTTFDGDETTALTFTATWGNLTSTLNLELPNLSTKILAKFIPSQQRRGMVFGYLYDGNDQPIPSQTMHIRQENPSRSEDVTTNSYGYFNCPVFDPLTAIVYMTYDGNYIYPSSSKTLNPRDSETWDDIIPIVNANQN